MALSSGAVEAPPRQAVAADGGSVLTMAGRRAGSPVAVKLVGVFPGNVELGLEPHPAVICLLDATTGRCLALMDGEAITGLRTAAGSALSVRALARDDARVLAVVGSGVQARAHLRMLPLVRPFSDVRLVARDPAAAARLGVAAGTVEGADVVCLCTRVLVAGPVVAVAPGHARHLGRLRAAGRRARPRAGRVVAAVRRDAPGVRAAAGGLRRARGARPVGGHRARRGAGSAAPRAARRPTRSRSTRRWGTSPRTPRPPSSSTARRSAPAWAATSTCEERQHRGRRGRPRRRCGTAALDTFERVELVAESGTNSTRTSREPPPAPSARHRGPPGPAPSYPRHAHRPRRRPRRPHDCGPHRARRRGRAAASPRDRLRRPAAERRSRDGPRRHPHDRPAAGPTDRPGRPRRA